MHDLARPDAFRSAARHADERRSRRAGDAQRATPSRQPFGGGEGIRTHDPLVANQVLYQLSYAPVCHCASRAQHSTSEPVFGRPWTSALEVVGLTGLEPVTSRLSGGCSNQLSYRPSSARKAEATSGETAADGRRPASRLRGEPGLQVRFVPVGRMAPLWSQHRPADPTRDEREGDPCLCANNLRFAIRCSARSELQREHRTSNMIR